MEGDDPADDIGLWCVYGAAHLLGAAEPHLSISVLQPWLCSDGSHSLSVERLSVVHYNKTHMDRRQRNDLSSQEGEWRRVGVETHMEGRGIMIISS